MNCDELRERLDAYLDGELGAEERRAADEHLGACLPCRRERDELADVVARAAALPAAMAPPRDLWPGILERVAPSAGRARRPRLAWVSLAAAAVLAAAVALPVALRWAGERDAEVPAAEGRASTASRTETLAVLAHSEDGVLQARRDLAAAVESGAGRIDPETARALEESARLIERAIGELRAALERDPMNGRLNHSLAAKYQMERELLSRVSRI